MVALQAIHTNKVAIHNSKLGMATVNKEDMAVAMVAIPNNKVMADTVANHNMCNNKLQRDLVWEVWVVQR